MPSLLQNLRFHDLAYLKIVAGLWGVELSAPDARQAATSLAQAMMDSSLVAEVVEALPHEAQAALADLLSHGGRLSWPLFARRYGSIREMGPGRRDRERPYLKPASPAEALWYRSLLGRTFFDTETGPEEFAFIPEDLIPLLSVARSTARDILGRPANPGERAHPIPVSDRILDDSCTLLAAYRLGLPLPEIEAAWVSPYLPLYPLTPATLATLLSTTGLIDAGRLPKPEPVRLFLEATRGEALVQLASTWLDSNEFNDLALIPGLSLEGDWENDPLLARRAVLDFLSTVPGDTWWSLSAFVQAVHQAHPDFQRPAGDYDSWFIRDRHTGAYFRGFQHWDSVEGALLRFIIIGPLHWLGLMDLAAPAPGEPPAAFRPSKWSASLLERTAPAGLNSEDEAIQVRSDARLRLPRQVPRSLRYLLARFCEWEGLGGDAYRYRVTAASLERSREQGLRASQLLTLLRRHAEVVPPILVKALERWEERGTEARLERLVVLRLSSPGILQELRASRAARFLGDPLGPAAVIVKSGAMDKILAALAEMGLLAEVYIDE
jgi:hypothetical protein